MFASRLVPHCDKAVERVSKIGETYTIYYTDGSKKETKDRNEALNASKTVSKESKPSFSVTSYSGFGELSYLDKKGFSSVLEAEKYAREMLNKYRSKYPKLAFYIHDDNVKSLDMRKSFVKVVDKVEPIKPTLPVYKNPPKNLPEKKNPMRKKELAKSFVEAWRQVSKEKGTK